ncbi:ABC transporter permease subunit [Dongia sp.]|uniref:ABC transporter permease subunit n=1 Tax=Dongia sp. TaxID=1977262 RepID=UPI0035B020F6
MTDLAALAVQPEVKGRSLWVDAYRRFSHNKAAVTGLVILLLVTIACFGAPYFGLHDPEEVDWSLESLSIPPNFELGYYFGTDQNGRDLFVRTLYGGQVSLIVGFVATLVSLVIGTLWGATAGFFGGRVDNVMMRIVDILYSIPFVFFVILLTVVFGRDMVLIYVAIGAVSWLDMARIVRGQTISIRRKEFIEAAHASGVSNWRIITRHIIPNCLGPVVVYMTLTVPAVILTESFLSYLGMGVQEPDSSWGTLISEGARSMDIAPWAVVFPSAVMVVTLLALNFVGDGLRDALDPKDR